MDTQPLFLARFVLIFLFPIHVDTLERMLQGTTTRPSFQSHMSNSLAAYLHSLLDAIEQQSQDAFQQWKYERTPVS
jgi:hypothetical protein